MMFRTVGRPSRSGHCSRRTCGRWVAVEDVLVVPPVKLQAVAGFETAVFSFTTDIPFLDRWGTPLLLGPGSVTVAHTADEHVPIAELHRAVDLYEQLARTLLARVSTSPSHSG